MNKKYEVMIPDQSYYYDGLRGALNRYIDLEAKKQNPMLFEHGTYIHFRVSVQRLRQDGYSDSAILRNFGRTMEY